MIMGLGFTNEKDRPVAPIAICHASNVFGTFADIYTKTEVDTIVDNNPGPTGATGATGPQGPTGATGPQGPTGTVDTNNFYTKTETDTELAT